MTHHARVTVPGSLQHIIARFVNRAHRLDGDAVRAEYLSRLGESVSQTDWRILGFALMSSHVHLAALAGHTPLQRWAQPLHGGFARWLQARAGSLGPVFAQRPTSIDIDPRRAGILLAYLHNNPVRAGLVADARGSAWTSHRGYVQLAPAPSWLDTESGLALSGFDASEQGRLAFDRLVRSRSGDPQGTLCDEHHLDALRETLRGALGAPVQFARPRLLGGASDGRTLAADLRLPEHAPLRPTWSGDLGIVIVRVAQGLRVPVAHLLSRSRRRPVVRARRLIVLTAVRYLGCSVTEIGALLGLTPSGASRLLHRDPPRVRALEPLASSLAAACWADPSGGAPMVDPATPAPDASDADAPGAF